MAEKRLDDMLWKNIRQIQRESDRQFAQWVLDARSDFLRLRLKQEPALRKLYLTAADNVAEEIRNLKPTIGKLTRNHLDALEKSLRYEAEQISQGISERLKDDLYKAVEAGASPLGRQLIKAIQDSKAPLDILKIQRGFADVNTAAVEALWARTHKGMMLSDRVWQTSDNARQAIRDIIWDGTARGRDAVKVARDLEKYVRHGAKTLTEDYPNMMDRMGRRIPKNLSYEALRLARTEMSNAFREGTYAAGRTNPSYRGVRWMLSSSHPVADICCRAGTMIQTTEGPKPIEEVTVGDLVLTHRARWQPVTRLYRRTIQAGSLIRLRFRVLRNRIREVVLTPNHPVLTDQGWIPAGTLQKGCRAVCLPLEQLAQPYQLRHDAVCIALRDSVESGTLLHAERGFGPQCDVGLLPHLHIEHNAFQDFLWPSLLPMSACGISRYPNAPHPIWGFSDRGDQPRGFVGFRQNGRTCLDGVSHSWGCSSQSLGHIRGYSIFGSCCMIRKHIPCRRLDRHVALLRDQSSSIHLSRNGDLARIVLREKSSCKRGTVALPFLTDYEQRIGDCRNVTWRFCWDGREDRGQVLFLYRSIHTFSWLLPPLSYINYSIYYGNSPFAELVSEEHVLTHGEIVYNLAVKNDNSYMANGIAVHNCDDFASADLYGLGPGGYPEGEEPPIAHPQCLCYVVPLVEDTATFVDRLVSWSHDPSSDPELEEWYNNIYRGQFSQTPTIQIASKTTELTETAKKLRVDLSDLADSAKDSLAQAFETALEHGKTIRTEVLITIDAETGHEIHSAIRGNANSVIFPDSLIELLKRAAKNSVVMVHNHPSSSAFSSEDLRVLSNFDSINWMTVVGHDGTRYAMRIGDGNRPTLTEVYDNWVSAVDVDFRHYQSKVISGELTRDEAWYEHSNKAMQILAKRLGWDYRRFRPDV